LQRVAQEGGSIDTLARALGDVEVGEPGATAVTRLADVRDAASLRFGAACLKQMDPAVLDPLVAGQWLAGYDRGAVLRGVRCPTLLLQADWTVGGMLPDADAQSAVAQLPSAVHVRLDGVGHLMHWLARDKVLTIVLGFLESLA
jgi:pimeloyl-ACP methyl ester carboxylesterase